MNKVENINPKTGRAVENKESEEDLTTRHGWVWYVIGGLVRVLMPVVFWPKVRGRKNIPRGSGVVLAANHISDLDAPLVVATCGLGKVSFLAKAELFRSKLGWAFRLTGAIPVDRARRNSGAVDLAVEKLKAGGVVSIMPEGTAKRKGGELLPFKLGAVRMAGGAGVPIVPVAISGKFRPFGLGRLKIEYGKPIEIRGDLEKANDKLRNTVERMLKGKENE